MKENVKILFKQYEENLNTIKAELDEIFEKTKKDIMLLLEENNQDNNNDNIKYWDRRMGVLAELWMAGESVTNDVWYEVCVSKGYKPSGIGGFFSSKENPRILKTSTRVMLLDEGKDAVCSWLTDNIQSEGTKPSKECYEKYKHLLDEHNYKPQVL